MYIFIKINIYICIYVDTYKCICISTGCETCTRHVTACIFTFWKTYLRHEWEMYFDLMWDMYATYIGMYLYFTLDMYETCVRHVFRLDVRHVCNMHWHVSAQRMSVWNARMHTLNCCSMWSLSMQNSLSNLLLESIPSPTGWIKSEVRMFPHRSNVGGGVLVRETLTVLVNRYEYAVKHIFMFVWACFVLCMCVCVCVWVCVCVCVCVCACVWCGSAWNPRCVGK